MSDNENNESDSDNPFDHIVVDEVDIDDRDLFMDRLHFSPMNSSDSDTDVASRQTVRPTELNNDSGDLVDYDRDLPGEHAYLGRDMLPISGCLVLEQNAVYELPLLAHHSIIFPNQILPMMPHITHAIRLCKEIEGSHVFGLVCPDESGKQMFQYGIICEVFEKEPEHDTDIVRIKARGRQRFKVLGPMRGLRDYLNITLQHVRILPEFTLHDPLLSVRLPSLNKYRLKCLGQKSDLVNSIKQRDSYLSSWPYFVYNQYDLDNIVKRIQKHFRQLNIDSFPSDPVALSFWVAHNLQLDTSKRLLLFKLDSALHRLQIELKCIEKCTSLRCKVCKNVIAKTSDLFAMSNDGIQSHYCNPEGWIHETFTVMHATDVRLHGQRSTQATWFPGYAWTIALCKSCRQHVGWLFTSVEGNLRPAKFWGLCRTSITQAIVEDNEL